MPVTVVGSIAFDSVKTPFGERERMLGGAAVHFALAASFFDEVRIVGPVGDDFGEDQLAVLRRRNIDTSGIEHIAGGKTFFWRAEYGWDLNSRETLETELGVFEGFEPTLSQAACSSDVLFLANIQPDLQRRVRAQCTDTRFTGLDTMNLWIDTARAALVKAINEVDCLIVNDAELRQLAGKPSLVGAAREVLSWSKTSGRAVVAKLGEYGAALITRDGYFSIPAFPLETVCDPTGAGDCFAGGFIGYIASQHGKHLTPTLLRRAMAYGTAIASFNVEEFGTERVARLRLDEVDERVVDLRRMTAFS
jgi:sugar/nucleoside kinase (ribokinase family)